MKKDTKKRALMYVPKKFVCGALTAAMVLSTMPISAMAAETKPLTKVTLSNEDTRYDNIVWGDKIQAAADAVGISLNYSWDIDGKTVYDEDGDDSTLDLADFADVVDKTVTLTVTGEGTDGKDVDVTASIDVEKRELASMTLESDEYSYTGKQVDPTISKVEDERSEEVDDTEYYPSGNNANINVGTDYTYTVEASKNSKLYKGSATAEYDIVADENAFVADDVTIDDSKCVYDGTQQKPAVTVKIDETTLEPEKDYEVTYGENISAGATAGTVTVTGKGNYAGATVSGKTFKIAAKTLNETDIAIDCEAGFTYDAEAKDLSDVQGATYVVTDSAVLAEDKKATPLTKTTDYTVTALEDATTTNNNKDAGTQLIVTFTGAGNYQGTIKKTFVIKAAALPALGEITSKTYTGEKITLTNKELFGETTRLVEGTDYEVSYLRNTDAAAAGDKDDNDASIAPTVTVTGKGNYAGTETKEFTITGKQDTGVAIATIADQVYTGEGIKPALKVTTDNGKTVLTEGKDYEVAYTNNINVSEVNASAKPTATVNFMGNYKDTEAKSKTFNITPLDVKDFTVTLKNNGQYDFLEAGYNAANFECDVTVDGNTLQKNKDYTVTIVNGDVIAESTATLPPTVIITLNDNIKNIKPAKTNMSKSATFSITKAGVSSFAINTDEGVVTVPTSPPSDGTNGYYAIYTGEDIKPTVKDVMAKGTALAADDYTVTYSNNKEVGTATVTVTAKDTEKVSGSKDETFEIKKADIEDGEVEFEGLYNDYYASYTGKAVKLAPVVTGVDGKVIPADQYTVTWAVTGKLSNADSRGSYPTVTSEGVNKKDFSSMGQEITVTVKMNDDAANHTGEATAKYIIGNMTTITSDMIEIKGEYTYNGKNQEPEVVVTGLDGETLVFGEDYTFSVSDSKNAGTQTVTVKAMGDEYTGSAKQTYEIKAKDIADLDLGEISASFAKDSAVGETTYTGKDIEMFQIGTVTNKDVTFDFSFASVDAEGKVTALESGKANAVGTYALVATGKGNYTGTKLYTVKVNPADFTDTAIVALSNTDKYDGTKETEPTVTVAVPGLPVTKDDYSVEVKPNGDGTATATITGRGNFIGTVVKTFDMVATDLKDATIATIGVKAYTGKEVTPDPLVRFNGVRLTADEDYEVTYKNNINAGTATVTITGKGAYTGTKTIDFTINPTKMTSEGITVKTIGAKGYTGKAITPVPAISYNGMKLVEGTDFTVQYSGNVNAGTASVKIIGMGNYKWAKTVNFEIVAKKLANAEVRVIGNKKYTGKAITPVPVVKVDGVRLTEGKDFTLQYSNNVKVGTATVKIIGTGNYKWATTITFKIVK